MTSERMRRRLDAFLDEADVAASANEWALVADKARAALAIEAENADALTFLRMAEANLGAPATTSAPMSQAPSAASAAQPESFAAGRYHVRRFLGEGGKKRVFLAHDELLDRDVAFALIKTDGLDDVGRERITREAQAMGRLGAHPNLVTIFDIGEEGGAPFVVTELMGGGDVEAVLADGVPQLTRTLEIVKGVTRGLAFAHGQGIVHRDLKPGNVWLTTDGAAKIGDFGLAVALNRSRLTLHGLMVGTVAYMPPEQALGGEVTPQSDLYSLGAMLYELVTGKPPFVGDEPTVVISQHLNSTPVAPSWNSDHCPPDLEALILHLLAKVPADRPASASAVLAALEAIDPNAPTASHSDSQANPLDRLARGVFVGRERELERLRSAFDGALAGRGSLVMLVGEPGIGKTRTTLELETYARMRGAKVLWGRAHEAAGAPPYWPWVQVARAYRELTPDDELRRKQYEPYAVELQRIFTALPSLFPNLPPPPDADSQEGQFRLYDALSSFLRAVAVETPLVVVLDDLHWADGATLAMLTHVTRELGRARVLVLGTYRDTDLDRRHPLSQALADLNREQMFTRLSLRGLTEDEVGDYIAQAAGIAPSRALVHRVFEETEGNPFFLSEVVNLMTQEGTLANTSISDVAIPEGVKEALGRRLDRLSEEANALLATLAVAGREFDHALASALSDHDDDATLRLLEEALRARVIEEQGAGQYRFTHALMQETLAGELSAARQVQLHGRIAEVIESLYGVDDREHLEQLALHYGESAVLNRSHAGRAVHYAYAAGQQAAQQFAWPEAAHHYDRCVSLLDAAASDGGAGIDPANLHLSLGIALRGSLELRRAYRAFMQAVDLFRQQADAIGLARTAYEVSQIFVPAPRLAGLLEEAAQGVAGRDDELWGNLVALIGINAAGDTMVAGVALPVEYGDLHARALQVAEEHGFATVERALLLTRAYIELGAYEFEAAVTDVRRVAAIEERLGALPGARGAAATPLALMALGMIDKAIGTFQKRADGIARFEPLRTRMTMQALTVPLALSRAQFDAIDAVAEDIRGSLFSGAAQAYALRVLLAGDIARVQEVLPPTELGAGSPMRLAGVRGVRMHLLAAIGLTDAASAELQGWRDAVSALGLFEQPYPPFHALFFAVAGMGGSALSMLDEREARWLYTALATGPGATVISAVFIVLRGIDTLRGELALRFGDIDNAERWFRHGIEFGRTWDLLLEVGCCLQGLAEVAERRGDIELARTHLDAAGELFAKHGVKLYLDEVLAKKQVLRA